MSKMTGLTSGAITAVDTVTIELVEADENPAVVIVRWPAKPTVFHPRSFPSGAVLLQSTIACQVITPVG